MDQYVSIHHSKSQSTCRVFYVSHKSILRSLQQRKDGDIAIVAPDSKGITRYYLFQNEEWVLMLSDLESL